MQQSRSSVEGLKVANTIQENLNYDATVTVWNQGIFNLTSNTLDDLINALDNFDYGIFVFSPDDILMLRDNKYKAARDNVVFELGLFIGRLGKEKVFFILPEHADDFHLPSDLLGVSPGKYDNTREDNNLIAALAVFCNQIRRKLEEFSFSNISGFENESYTAKKLIIEKPSNWEFNLTRSLLKPRLESIKIEKEEISKGFKFSKSIKMTAIEFSDWIGQTIIDFKKLILIFGGFK